MVAATSIIYFALLLSTFYYSATFLTVHTYVSFIFVVLLFLSFVLFYYSSSGHVMRSQGLVHQVIGSHTVSPGPTPPPTLHSPRCIDYIFLFNT